MYYLILSTYIDPPSVNVITSKNMTPAIIDGFDIRILWDVSYHMTQNFHSAKFL